MAVDRDRVRRIARQLKSDMDQDPSLRDQWRRNPFRVLHQRGLTAEEMAEGHELGGPHDDLWSSMGQLE